MQGIALEFYRRHLWSYELVSFTVDFSLTDMAGTATARGSTCTAKGAQQLQGGKIICADT